MSTITAIHEAKQRLGALDFSEVNERVLDIDTRVEQLKAARETARTRHAAIMRELQDMRDPAHDKCRLERNAAAIADALLTGRPAGEALALAPTKDALEQERDALSNTITEFGSRIRQADAERDALRRAISREALDLLRPLCASIERDAGEAALALQKAFASLSGISTVLSLNPPGYLEAKAAMDALQAQGGLLRRSSMIETPREIVEVLDTLAQKGSLFQAGVGRRTQTHDYQQAAALGRARNPLPDPAPQEPRMYRP